MNRLLCIFLIFGLATGGSFASAESKNLAPRSLTLCTLIMKRSLEFAVQRFSDGSTAPMNGYLPTLYSVDNMLDTLYSDAIESRAFPLMSLQEDPEPHSATLVSHPESRLSPDLKTRRNIAKLRGQMDLVLG
ncbi:MAG: hypothetical protein AAF202_13540, partial [Pseudomonadota bacterium]